MNTLAGASGNCSVVARVEPSSDALLGFELADSGTCWWPSPKKFWRIALAPRELAFGRCRRTGSQINRALGHAMSLFGLRRELYSVFQRACQFVIRFEGRVGRAWASVRREFRIAWALLPSAKYNSSCCGRVSFQNGSCGSHCTVHGGQGCCFDFGTLAIYGPDACNFETPKCFGRGGRLVHLLGLTITKPCALVLVLSSLKSRQNFTLPRNGECSAFDAEIAQSASWDSSVKLPFGFSEPSAGESCRESIRP